MFELPERFDVLRIHIFGLAATALLAWATFASRSSAEALIAAACISLIIFLLWPPAAIKLEVVDVGILGLLLTGAVASLYPLYRPAAVKQLCLEATATVLYFFVISRRVKLRPFLYGMLVLAFAYECRGIYRFNKGFEAWAVHGFSNLSDFRAFVTLGSEHTPVGNNNVVYLIVLWLSLLSMRYFKNSRRWSIFNAIVLMACIICVLLSFSRGLYIASLVSICVSCTANRRSLLAFCLGFITLLITMRLANGRSSIVSAIVTTSRISRTASQRLSTAGRLKAAEEGITICKRFLKIGAGPSNYAIARQEVISCDGPCVFSQPFNEALTITIEQGLGGLFCIIVVVAGSIAPRYCMNDESLVSTRVEGIALVVSLIIYGCCESFLFASPESALWTFAGLALLRRSLISSTRFRAEWRMSALGRYCVVGSMLLIALCAHHFFDLENTLNGKDPEAAYNRGPDKLMSDPYRGYLHVCAKVREQIFGIGAQRSLEDTMLVSENDKRTAHNAIVSLHAAMNNLPEEDSGWINLAELNLMVGDLRAADDSAARAVKLCPEDYRYRLISGIIDDKRMDSYDAKVQYQQAIEEYPSLLTSPFWMRLESRNRSLAVTAINGAFSELGVAFETHKDPRYAALLARMFASVQEWDAAEKMTSVALTQLPNLEGVWELAAEESLRKGELSRASLEADKALFLNPNDVLVHEDLAQISIRRGDLRSALREGRRAFELISGRHSSSSHRAILKYSYGLGTHSVSDDVSAYSPFDTEPQFPFIDFFDHLADQFAALGLDDEAVICQNLAAQSRHAISRNEKEQS